jgi:hypothetical protein
MLGYCSSNGFIQRLPCRLPHGRILIRIGNQTQHLHRLPQRPSSFNFIPLNRPPNLPLLVHLFHTAQLHQVVQRAADLILRQRGQMNSGPLAVTLFHHLRRVNPGGHIVSLRLDDAPKNGGIFSRNLLGDGFDYAADYHERPGRHDQITFFGGGDVAQRGQDTGCYSRFFSEFAKIKLKNLPLDAFCFLTYAFENNLASFGDMAVQCGPIARSCTMRVSKSAALRRRKSPSR